MLNCISLKIEYYLMVEAKSCLEMTNSIIL
nr:MAG TPA: hypothetical protein [Caudoviricetes sp.]